MSTIDTQTPIVSADWLRDHHGAPHMKVLDASWHMPASNRDARAEFEDGHIPGAAYFDIDAVSDPESSLPHMLPSAAAFAHDAGALGIANADHVVVYDTVGLFSAARAWWMFRAFGHERVSVLDGGLPAWTASGGPIDTGPAAPVLATYEASDPSPAVVALQEMQEISTAASHVILDARPAGRFTGADPEPRPGLPSGHMPNAISMPFSSVIADDGRLKAPDELRALLGNAGALSGRPVVTTCGSGVTAAVLSLALARIGVTGSSLYDGSWTEWASTPGCPIETG